MVPARRRSSPVWPAQPRHVRIAAAPAPHRAAAVPDTAPRGWVPARRVPTLRRTEARRPSCASLPRTPRRKTTPTRSRNRPRAGPVTTGCAFPCCAFRRLPRPPDRADRFAKPHPDTDNPTVDPAAARPPVHQSRPRKLPVRQPKSGKGNARVKSTQAPENALTHQIANA